MYKKYIKRFFDIIFSLSGILILSPLMLFIALLVWVNLGSPVIYKQDRPGKGERIFKIYKFRSMNNKKDETGVLLTDAKRLTRFGKILRSTSLDELPELFNILKGDMSVVGPRPLLVSYLPLYNEEQRHRHDVRPGLTGLAQIRGRNAICWEKKFEWDIIYIKNMCLFLDIIIIFDTIKIVVLRKGIHAKDHETIEKFSGVKK